MHSGSCSETRAESGSNIKCNIKAKKEKLEAKFLGNNMASSIGKARFVKKFLLFEKLW
jgi:hypothetical protein